ncbi:MAG: aspartate aminotransferase family protein [Myxococcales bacterium]|nr:aspartate aminotransferase family protein [Myxococcales bacterium]MCB9701641.1 aspartate aminotransferase family protein [Myxococcales bacterium]
MRIPANGLDDDTLFATLESFRAQDVSWRDGRTWAYVYDPGAEADAVLKRAFTMYLSENGLDPTAFPSVLRLENELVAMAAAHLGGDADVVGNFTSGGTESIMLAVKTARDHARAFRPQIARPEMILPETAHAAFHKAAHFLGVEVVLTPVDPVTFKADVEAMRAAITENTILLVGSAVSYAHCVIDPIREIAALAAERQLLCHVDACMGGFLLPYFKRLGEPVPDFDLSVPGVTSISMDFHKYAFAAKGASVVLHRNRELRRHQIYACSNWTGYTIVNATVQSSKSAGPLAAAWAVLHHFGDAGYMEIARQVLDGTKRLCAGIDAIDGLRVLGEPEMNLIAFTSDEVDVFHLTDEMKMKGWYIQPQLSYGASKENVHLSVNPNCLQWIEPFLVDLAACVESAKALPPSPLVGVIRQMFAAFDPSTGIDPAMMKQMMAMGGISASALPERMAEINQVLNALPIRVRELLLVEFMNELYAPTHDEAAR